MKIKFIYTLLLIFSLTGCSISKTDLSPVQDKNDQHDLSSANTQEKETSKQTHENSDNSDTSTSNQTSESSISNDSGHVFEKTPLNQTPFLITESNISGYHDLITNVSDLNLNLDLSDIRLWALIEHLQTYTYNIKPNQIGEVSLPDSLFTLTNKLNHLPEDYEPANLQIPNVLFSIDQYDEKKNLRPESALALEEMFAAAEQEGYSLFAISGYRSYKRQQSIYNNKVSTRGVEESDKVSARPGHSEHQTGLAMDISCESVNYGLEYSFGDTDEGIWVAKHCYEFGFIIRYPEDKIDITGYNYEPWHLRYIGKELAAYVYENNLTLEELYASILNQLQN